MLFRRDSLFVALLTACCYIEVSAFAATATAERRLVASEAGHSASFERRIDSSGQTYVLATIQQGRKTTEISIKPMEIVFGDGYSIRRDVVMDSSGQTSRPRPPFSQHLETITVFSPERDTYATARIHLKAPLATVTGRQGFARFLDASNSFRLLVANRTFIGESVYQGRGDDDCLAEGAFFVTSVADLTIGGPHTVEAGQAFVDRGLSFAQACARE